MKIGSKAPTFTLPDQHGKQRKLAEFAGHWVVLYFYPRDDTPGCTTEACEFTAALPQLQKLDAVVLGVSPDTVEKHLKFVQKHRLGVTLLADPEKAVLGKYGAFGKKMMYGKEVEGVIRSTVLIDPLGKVAFHWAKVSAKGHAAAVAAKLKELRAATSA